MTRVVNTLLRSSVPLLLLACSSTEPAPEPEALRLILHPGAVLAPVLVPWQGSSRLDPRIVTAGGDTAAVTGTVTFRSDDTLIAEVDDAGLVTGVTPGFALIVGTLRERSQDLADTVQVSVFCVSGQMVEVTPSTFELAVGGSFTPGARLSVCQAVHRVDAPPDVVWQSSDPATLQVDQVTGTTVALKPGEAFVTATDRTYGPLHTRVAVTVR
jgi:hypothetical protein